MASVKLLTEIIGENQLTEHLVRLKLFDGISPFSQSRPVSPALQIHLQLFSSYSGRHVPLFLQGQPLHDDYKELNQIYLIAVSGDASVQIIFLGVTALHLATRVFMSGNHIDRRQFLKGILWLIKASLAKRCVSVLKV